MCNMIIKEEYKAFFSRSTSDLPAPVSKISRAAFTFHRESNLYYQEEQTSLRNTECVCCVLNSGKPFGKKERKIPMLELIAR